MSHIGVYVGEDWYTHLSTYEDHAPILDISAGSAMVALSLASQEVSAPAVEFARDYAGADAYCRAKFALAAHTFSLARELSGTGVTVNVVHPATYMDTAMVREAGISPWTSVADGAAAVLALATGESGARSGGRFFDGVRPARAHEGTYDRTVQDRLDAELDRVLG